MVRLHSREYDGQRRRVCMTCRRAVEEGKQWVPTDSADQARGANFGRPRVVPRSALRDITRTARTNSNTPSEGVHAQASATECQTPAERPGDTLCRGVTREGMPSRERARRTHKRKRRRRHPLPHPQYVRPLRVGQQVRQTASHRVRGEAPCQVSCVAALHFPKHCSWAC